jgi:peptidoglycan hydrolase-like protein with peptidoglycan-binding domain
MNSEEEGDLPRFGISTGIVGLTVAILSFAIAYNTLTQTAPHSLLADGALLSDTDPITGSTRVTVDSDNARPGTVTLRYDPTVENVQRELIASGLYSGEVDGVTGRRTRLAIVAYQRANRLEETGAATPQLVEHIRYTRQIADAANMPEARLDGPRVLRRAKPVDTVTRVQVGLAELGYEPGTINGKLGPQTRTAILNFESDRGIALTGDISATLIAELDKMSIHRKTSDN